MQRKLALLLFVAVSISRPVLASPKISSDRAPEIGKISEVLQKYSLGSNNSELEIDRVDILGVHIFPAKTIEGVLEISPGDPLDHSKVLQTEQNIQELYRIHGYEKTRIQSKLSRKRRDKISETILQFEVSEGLPTRIGTVEIISNSLQDSNSKNFWNDHLLKITKALGVNNGDVLDYERIADGKRAIQELLASDRYIGIKAEESVIQESSSKFGKIYENDVARWVKLRIQIELGDRVKFGFRGNTVFTNNYLEGLIEEQRVLGLGSDYVPVLKKRIEDEYRAAGYAKIEITPYTFEHPNRNERQVTFAIMEGLRVKIDSLSFDGNLIFSSKELSEQFYLKAGGLIQNRFFVEKDVEKAAEHLVEWMKEKGYLGARVVAVNSTFLPYSRSSPTNSSVKVLIYLYEGEQSLVENVSVEGVKVFTPEIVKKVLEIQEGNPLNLFALVEGIESLKKMYRDLGYLDVRILNEGTETLILYTEDNRNASINLRIDEGYQYKLSKIEIEGLVNTKNSFVQKELRFKVGDVLSEAQIFETERQLRKLGIFSTVSLKAIDDPQIPGSKIMKILLQEADRGTLTWGPGLRNDLGLKLFGQLSYANLWGQGHTLSLNANINRRFQNYNFGEGQLLLSYHWANFLLRDLSFRPSLDWGRTQYINLSADKMSVSALWDKPLFQKPNLVGSFTYSFEKIKQFNAILSTDDQEIQIGTITPRITLDLRDSPLVPTKGYYATYWFDLASPVLGTQTVPYTIAYFRAQVRNDYHLPIWRGISLYLSFRSGYEQTLADRAPDATYDAIPFIKLFALGGVGSVRGYAESSIYRSQTVNSSLSYVNYRTQLDFPFFGSLKLGVFFDAANLLVDQDFSFNSGLLMGTGFGLHYQSPVGAINLDWGFKVKPLPNQDPSILHFSVGVI